MFDIIPPQYKMAVAIAGVVLLMGVEAYFVRDYYVMQGEAKVAKINSDNQQAQIDRDKLIKKEEAKAQAVKDKLEKDNVQAKKDIAAANNRYAAYVRAHGLRDPGSKTPGEQLPSDSGTASCSNSQPATDGKLSEQASDFLLALTRSADDLAADYKTCRDWAIKMHEWSQRNSDITTPSRD